jgi:sarcosine oxidase gamma subunit
VVSAGGSALGNAASAAGVEVAGLSVTLRREFKIGSLRYFDGAGALAWDLRAVLGAPLPGPLRAAGYPAGPSGEIILAWRSPTETIVLASDAPAFAAVAARVAEDATRGCFIDQTGGLHAWEASGARTVDLLERVGSAASMPALGEARTSRVAELPVLCLCVHEARVLLLVERIYSEHLLGWISETAADF